MCWTKLLQSVATLGLFMAFSPAWAQLLPLEAKDAPKGCACSFAATDRAREPLFYWSLEGKRQGVMRDATGARALPLQSEKYFPAKHEPLLSGDRIVAFFADPTWQVQVMGSVESACKFQQAQCKTTLKARLMVQKEGGARTPIEVQGSCNCQP